MFTIKYYLMELCFKICTKYLNWYLEEAYGTCDMEMVDDSEGEHEGVTVNFPGCHACKATKVRQLLEQLNK